MLKKFSVLSITCLFFSCFVSGQVKVTPISTLLDSAYYHFDRKNMDIALNYTTEAEAYMEKQEIKDPPFLLKIHHLKAEILFNWYKLNEAQEEYEILLELSSKFPDTLKQIQALGGLGNIKAAQGDYLPSLLYNHQAKEIAKDFHEGVYYSIIGNMASSYIQAGQYEEALKNLILTRDYFEKTKKTESLAIVYNNIGELYREYLQNPKLAKSHLKKAIAINKEIKSSYQLTKNYNNMGLIYQTYEQKPDSALYFLKRSNEIRDSIGDEGGKAIGFYNIGNIYTGLEDYDNAVLNFQKTLDISEKYAIHEGIYFANIGLGRVYKKMKQPEKALAYFKAAYKAAQNSGLLENMIGVEKEFYNFYKDKGQAEKALYWMEQFYEKEDSINSNLRSEGLANLQTLYEKQLSDKENEVLKSQQSEDKALILSQKRSQTLYIFLTIFLFLVTIALIAIYLERQKVLKMEKHSKATLERQYELLKEQEGKLNGLNQLKNQIFSVLGHDLRAPLISILGYIEITEIQNTNTENSEMLSHLKNETRQTLETLENILSWSRLQMDEINISRKEINFSTFFEDIKAMYIHSARLKGVEIQFDIGEDIYITANENQLRSIVSNLISNAVKFSPPDEKVWVHLEKSPGTIELRVINKGRTIDPAITTHLNDKNHEMSTPGTRGEKGTGIGLKLASEFATQNNGLLFFENRSEGTEAVVRFSV